MKKNQRDTCTINLTKAINLDQHTGRGLARQCSWIQERKETGGQGWRCPRDGQAPRLSLGSKVELPLQVGSGHGPGALHIGYTGLAQGKPVPLGKAKEWIPSS